MFFFDKPYISDFIKKSVRDYNIPVVATDIVKGIELYSGTTIISEEEAITRIKSDPNTRIYTTSENAIGWLAKHLSFSNLPKQIELFKDKILFREMTRELYPDYFFQGVQVEDLETLELSGLPLPFIIKPAVGFFSMGVYKVSQYSEWPETVALIQKEIRQSKDLYPEEVLDTSAFIIEQTINGEEYAIDAYYSDTGEPVILSVFKHTFSSENDVSDRIYTTSKEIVESNLDEFTVFVNKIGKLAGVKNFPVHIELRRENDGTLLPIEVNPMRFGGWCTTADTASYAYGFNPYRLYYQQQRPDWGKAFSGKEDSLFSIIVLDNSTAVSGDTITSFNYEEVLSSFEKPLELRKIDFKQYPVFGFVFVESRKDNSQELNAILHSDLSEFIATN